MAKTYNVKNSSEAKKIIIKLIADKIKEVSNGNKVKINIRLDNNE